MSGCLSLVPYMEGNVFVLCQLAIAFSMGRLDGQLQSLRHHIVGAAILLQRPSHSFFNF